MINPQQPVGPDPRSEVDRVEFCIDIPVTVVVEADGDTDIESVKREARENLQTALNGVWGFHCDAYLEDCEFIGFQ